MLHSCALMLLPLDESSPLGWASRGYPSAISASTSGCTTVHCTMYEGSQHI